MAKLQLLTTQALRAEYARERMAYQGPSYLSRVMLWLEGDNIKVPWITGYSSSMKARTASPVGETPTAASIDLVVEEFEASTKIPLADMRRDMTGAVQRGVLLGELADRSEEHKEDMFLDALIAGATTTGYDGKYVFATDHADTGGSYTTAQSNKVNVDISTLPVSIHGTTTTPSIEELAWAALEGVRRLQGFRDSMGIYVNRRVRSVDVFLSNSMWVQAKAIRKALTGAGASSVINEATKEGEVTMNFNPLPYLDTWTDKIVVVRSDSRRKFVIGAEEALEAEIALKISTPENSDLARQGEYYGVEARANRKVKAGDWRQAVELTLT